VGKNLVTQADYETQSRSMPGSRLPSKLLKPVYGAEVAMENTVIRAPFSGRSDQDADIGEMVVPMAASVSSKSAVVTIADMSHFRWKLMCPSPISNMLFPASRARYTGCISGRALPGICCKDRSDRGSVEATFWSRLHL